MSSSYAYNFQIPEYDDYLKFEANYTTRATHNVRVNSNLFVQDKNIYDEIVSLSNYKRQIQDPWIAFSSNAAVAASNAAYNLSNYTVPKLTSTSNLAVNTSNWAYPKLTATSNVAYATSNVAYPASNVAYLTSNVAYTTSNVAYATSNVAYTTSNVAYNTSNVSYALSNYAYSNVARVDATIGTQSNYLYSHVQPSSFANTTLMGLSNNVLVGASFYMQFPPVATANTWTVANNPIPFMNGQYTVTASRPASGSNNDVWKAFDGAYTTFYQPDATTLFSKTTGSLINTSQGVSFNGANNISTTYNGIDLTIILPTDLVLKSFSIRNTSAFDAARTFTLFGSPDGFQWTWMFNQNEVPAAEVALRIFNLPENTTPFKRYKLIFTRFLGGGTADFVPGISLFSVRGLKPDSPVPSLYTSRDTGFVGVWSSNPTVQLDVSGTVKASGDLLVGGRIRANADVYIGSNEALESNKSLAGFMTSHDDMWRLDTQKVLSKYTVGCGSNFLLYKGDPSSNQYLNISYEDTWISSCVVQNNIAPSSDITFSNLFLANDVKSAMYNVYQNRSKLRVANDLWLGTNSVYCNRSVVRALYWNPAVGTGDADTVGNARMATVRYDAANPATASGSTVSGDLTVPPTQRTIVDVDGKIPWGVLKDVPDLAGDVGTQIGAALGLVGAGALAGLTGAALWQMLVGGGTNPTTGATFDGIQGQRGPEGRQGEQGVSVSMIALNTAGDKINFTMSDGTIKQVDYSLKQITDVTQSTANMFRVNYNTGSFDNVTITIDYDSLANAITYESLANALNQQTLAQNLLSHPGFTDAITLTVREAFENGTISIGQLMEIQNIKQGLKNSVQSVVDTTKSVGTSVKSGAQKAAEKMAGGGKRLISGFKNIIQNPLAEASIAGPSSDVSQTFTSLMPPSV